MIDTLELALADTVAGMTKNERLALIEYHGEAMFATERDNPRRHVHGAICMFISAVNGNPGSGAAPSLRRTLETLDLPYLNALVVVRRKLAGSGFAVEFHRQLGEFAGHIHDARIVVDRQVMAEAKRIVNAFEYAEIGVTFADAAGNPVEPFAE